MAERSEVTVRSSESTERSMPAIGCAGRCRDCRDRRRRPAARQTEPAPPRRSDPRPRDREGHDRDPAVPGRGAEERRAHPRARQARVSIAASAFHRVTATLVQFGDPQSRDMSTEGYWGNGNSGSPIGVFELSKKRTHVRGAVGLAHCGQPAWRRQPDLHHERREPEPRRQARRHRPGHRGHGGRRQVAVTDMIKNTTLK